MQTQRICITTGEPSGIGPDVCLSIALQNWSCQLIFIADPELLEQRAKLLGLSVHINLIDLTTPATAHQAGIVNVVRISLNTTSHAGRLNKLNAPYVISTLEKGASLCLSHQCAALVTAPVQKSIINEAGIKFSGHTEFFADYCGGYPVMMLANSKLRVALATTHLPLRKVPEAITSSLLERVIKILDYDLKDKFSISSPNILVCGLNPHAGESGHLGLEEQEIIQPVVNKLRKQGIRLSNPLPADTAFTPAVLAKYDVVLAMYHDQGLPVLKSSGFGESVNITLGLPIIRTSVDHGTALDLAGSGKADAGSLMSALRMAQRIIQKNNE